MRSHIVAPALLTDGDWKRILGSTALLQRCDGHLITWLTEVIRHLRPAGVSARSLTSTSSQCTGYLTKQISAYAYHSHFMTGLSFFLFYFSFFPSLLLFQSHALSVKYTVRLTSLLVG